MSQVDTAARSPIRTAKRHVEGLPYAEVAEVLGRPVGTVKTHVHRGVRQLREQLEAREEQVQR